MVTNLKHVMCINKTLFLPSGTCSLGNTDYLNTEAHIRYTSNVKDSELHGDWSLLETDSINGRIDIY